MKLKEMASITTIGLLISTNIYTAKIVNKLDKDIVSKDKEIEYLGKTNDDLGCQVSNLLNDNKKLSYQINDISFKKVVFNPDDLTQKSNVGQKQLELIFKNNEKYNGMIGLESSFINAEREFGVNAIFLMSLVSQESSYATSSRALSSNNLTGYAVYSNSSKGATFSSKQESIMKTAELLSRDYLSKDGKHYKGRDIWNVNKTYCKTPNEPFSWSKGIINIAHTYVAKINSL